MASTLWHVWLNEAAAMAQSFGFEPNEGVAFVRSQWLRQVIIKEGDAGNDFYIIEKGGVKCIKRMPVR